MCALSGQRRPNPEVQSRTAAEKQETDSEGEDAEKVHLSAEGAAPEPGKKALVFCVWTAAKSWMRRSRIETNDAE